VGLRGKLQEQEQNEPLNRAEEMKLIQTLTERLEQTEQEKSNLYSENLKLRSENQELRSKLMSSVEQIELLKSRAASVNEIELQNKELLRSAKEAETTSANALAKAEQERQRAKYEKEQTRIANEEQRHEAQKRQEAEKKAKSAIASESDTKRRYTALFNGIMIITISLAILMAYSRHSIFAECGKWFSDRADNIRAITSWINTTYLSIAEIFSGIPAVLCYIISVMIMLAGTAVVIMMFVSVCGHFKVGTRVMSILGEYDDGIKAIITVSVSISLFYVCLFMYEPIKNIIPSNIFSTWLWMSLIGTIVINGKEIIRGIKDV